MYTLIAYLGWQTSWVAAIPMQALRFSSLVVWPPRPSPHVASRKLLLGIKMLVHVALKSPAALAPWRAAKVAAKRATKGGKLHCE